MLTLDEAIQKLSKEKRGMAIMGREAEWAEIAEWLKELKALKEAPKGDLISREVLKRDFEERNKACDKWIANAKDEETKIRADATKNFIIEVIMTINNAPSVDITEEQAIDKLHEIGWLPKHDKEMTERPQGEWIRRNVSFGYVDLECSLCHCECECIEADKIPSNYCPNCGAKMKGGAE